VRLRWLFAIAGGRSARASVVTALAVEGGNLFAASKDNVL
jgi:hypothetical protein